MARKDLIKDLTYGDIRFFICTAPKEEVKKTTWISTKDMLTLHNVKLKEMVEGLDPVFILKSNEKLFEYNYCYFYDTKRFYWISEPPILLPQGMMEIRCEVDPLYSFMLEIGDCMAFEDRSSNIGTGYIEDNEIVFNSSPLGKIYEFTNGIGSKAFKDHSYIISVANNLAYASKFSPGDDPVKDNDYLDYPQPQQDADAQTLIQAIFDVIDIWRKADWDYSQDNRNQNGYVDCSSLVARSIRQALGLPSSVFKTGVDENHLYDCASAIAYWFLQNPNYALQPASPNTCLLNGQCFENAYRLRPGDLVFFISNSHKDRFPSCWGDDATQHIDGSTTFDNKYFCRDVFGASDGKGIYKMFNGEYFYGISHIAIVHDCLIDDENIYDPLNGYIYTAENKRLRTDTDPNAETFKPVKDESGMWLLEALPYKNGTPVHPYYRILTTYINGQFKKNFNCMPVNVGAGNILYNRREATQDITSSYGEFGQFDESMSVDAYDWSDNTIAFYIRPDYKKMFDELREQEGE